MSDKSYEDKARDWIDLNFITWSKDGDLMKHHWTVSPNGNYTDECLIGAMHALGVIGYLRRQGRDDGPSNFLGQVAKAQANVKKWSGIEVGFWSAIGAHLMGRSIRLPGDHYAVPMRQDGPFRRRASHG